MKINKKLHKVMQEHGDTQQDLAEYLGLKRYQSIYLKMYGKSIWSDQQKRKVCKKYGKTEKELGL